MNVKEIRYSELAKAGIAREFPDESRRASLIVSLKFYLGRDHERVSVRSKAFQDIEVYWYPFGGWRVLYEVQDDAILVWSFREVRQSN